MINFLLNRRAKLQTEKSSQRRTSKNGKKRGRFGRRRAIGHHAEDATPNDKANVENPSSAQLQDSFNTSLTSLSTTRTFQDIEFNASLTSLGGPPVTVSPAAKKNIHQHDIFNASLNSLSTQNSNLSRDSWASNTPSFSLMVMNNNNSGDLGGLVIEGNNRSSSSLRFNDSSSSLSLGDLGFEHDDDYRIDEEMEEPSNQDHVDQAREEDHDQNDYDPIPSPKYERLIFRDGSIFEGIHVRGMLLKGQMWYSNGATYDGTFFNGKRHGKGVCVFPNGGGTYVGCWNHGNMSGMGIMVYQDGGMLWGDFRRGELHGHGTEILPDGTVYHEGIWDEGHPLTCNSRWSSRW